jgi:hypothetical protein
MLNTAHTAWQRGCKSGWPINGQTATINSPVAWWLPTRPLSGPKTATAHSQRPLGKAWPVPDTRNFGACLPTSALQAVGSSSKSPPVSPPRPARHVGACPVLLATQACRSGSGYVQRVGLRMTAILTRL